MNGKEQSSQIIDGLLFPKIFQTFRMAIQPSKLTIAFLAVVVICLAGLLMDVRKTVVATSSYTGGATTELQVYMERPEQVLLFIETHKSQGQHKGVFSTLWHFASKKFHSALASLFAFNLPGVAANVADCFKAIEWALRYHFIYCFFFFIVKLAVLSVAGGSICRIAALQFAKGEKPGLTEALRFSSKKFKSLFTAPLAPIGIVIFMALLIFILGLLGNIPWLGELIIGFAMPFALIAGVLMAVVLIGTVAGFNLMYPAIAYESEDCFDAISRSFSYVYAKPWRMGFYTVVAAVYGAICYTFVRFFAFLLLWVTRWSLQIGVRFENSSRQVNKLAAIWPEPSFLDLTGSAGPVSTNWSESIAVFFVGLWLLVIVGLLVAFLISFYFSANTIIYAALRKKVDNTAMEDVYTHYDETQTEPITTTESVSEESKQQPEAEKPKSKRSKTKKSKTQDNQEREQTTDSSGKT